MDSRSFLKAYFNLKLERLVSKLPRFSKKRIISIWRFLFGSIIVLYGWYLTSAGWYSNQNNIDGIIGNLHVTVLEIILFSALFNWYTKKNDQLKKEGIINILYYKIYDSLVECIYVLKGGFGFEDKIYVYFGEKVVCSGNYKLFDFYCENSDLFVKEALYDIDKDFVKNYLDSVVKLIEVIRWVYTFFGVHIDNELFITLLKAEDRANNMLSSVGKKNLAVNQEEKSEIIKNLIAESGFVVHNLLDLKDILEKRSDRIILPKEFDTITKKKREEARDLMIKMKSELHLE